MRSLPIALSLLMIPSALQAQEKPKGGGEGPIQDNSFLIEEAYNQEPGVVQHISTWTRTRLARDWVYTFTQEWPVGGQKHQFSYTLPIQRLQASPDGRTGTGDILLNYRYQLLGDGDAPVAVSPRLSAILPTGSDTQGRGNGALGGQVNLPLSLVLTPSLISHTNAGATWIPRARNAAGEKADLGGWNVGQSLVWLAHPAFNAFVEYVYTAMDTVTGPGQKARIRSAYLSPSIRWAHNFPSGLQIVPGIAVPIGVGPSSRERAIFLYLSFEAPMWKPK